MIRIGIDDTDTVGTRGTNHVARELVARLGFDRGGRRARVMRHQLLFDARVPYTSKNGSASITLEDAPAAAAGEITLAVRDLMKQWFIDGSDPGLCVATDVVAEVVAWGQRCQRALVDQAEARALARRFGIHLEGLGGTEGGVIGALAAVGLEATGDDGRIVHLGGWPWPDDMKGVVDMRCLFERGVDEIRDTKSGAPVDGGTIDIGKRLRPDWRGGRIVVFAEPIAGSDARWLALRQ